MFLLVLRAAFMALLIGVGLFAFNLFVDLNTGTDAELLSGLIAGGAVAALGGLVLAIDMLLLRQKQVSIVSAVLFGLLLGLLLGWLFSLALTPLLEASFDSLDPKRFAKLVLLVRMTLFVVCCYVTISTFMQTKDDMRLIIPYIEFSRQVRGGRPLVLDTSVIIDGRIADLCDTRIVESRLIVPRFVLQELQAIADSSDKLKRNRGRRGLEILKRLQTNPRNELQMHDGFPQEAKPGEKLRVDERLVQFAKTIGGRVVTNDANLNKIAQLQGVDVVNLHEVANALKTVALPGEYLFVRVVKQGDQPNQGVGYLDDGTMIVIEQGKPHVGNEVSILVTSVLQTPAGRMIFGRPEQRPPEGAGPSGSFVPVPGPGTGTGTGPRGGGSSATGYSPVAAPQRGSNPDIGGSRSSNVPPPPKA